MDNSDDCDLFVNLVSKYFVTYARLSECIEY